MRKLSKRVFSFVLALVLCISVVGVSTNKVFAADVPTVTITPLVTDSVNKQAFEVSTTVDAQYKAYYGDVLSGEGAVPEGTSTLNFDTNSEVKLEVFAPYINDNGATRYVTVRSTSINAYWVDVFCVTEDDVTLKSDRIKLSKHNEPQVVYNAPAVIDNGASEYHAANPSVVFKYGDGSKKITYSLVMKDAKTVTINYVDELDAILFTEEKVLNFGDTVAIEAPATYTANEKNYVLKTTGSYDVTYENAQSVYTFEYAEQAPAAQVPYEITVDLVDENGNLLHTMKKSVDVGKQVTVELPATYEVGLKKYALAEDQAASIVRDYASNESKAYTVKYELVAETAGYTVTINLVDKATEKVLETVTATVEADGAPFTYDISSKNFIEKAGVTYQVLAGQGNSKGKVVHAFGDAVKTYNLYYAAKQEDVPQPYVVTMRYICVNNNAVLATETQIVELNSSVTFEAAPKTLKVEGKEYILLNGQEGVTVHKYNDDQTSFEIYYRDSSVKLENDDVIYIPGTNPDQGEENQPTTDDDAEVDTTVNPGTQNGPAQNVNTGSNATDDENEEPSASNDVETNEEPSAPTDAETDEEPSNPTDAETEEEPSVPDDELEIIDDEEVPLANAPSDNASQGGPSAMPFVLGGVGLAVLIALAILLIVKKRKTA